MFPSTLFAAANRLTTAFEQGSYVEADIKLLEAAIPNLLDDGLDAFATLSCSVKPIIKAKRHIRAERAAHIINVIGTDNPNIRSKVTSIAQRLKSELERRLRRIGHWGKTADVFPSLPIKRRRLLGEEIEKLIRPSRQALARARTEEDRLRVNFEKTSLIKFVQRKEAKRLWTAAKEEIERCESKLADATKICESSDWRQKMQMSIDQHNAEVDEAERTTQFWLQVRRDVDMHKPRLHDFWNHAKEGIDNIIVSDWFPNTEYPDFIEFVKLALTCRYDEAKQQLRRLRIRVMPAANLLDELYEAARENLLQARSDGYGHVAVSSYAPLAQRTLDLAEPQLTDLTKLEPPSDATAVHRWMSYEDLLCDPRSYKLQPLWCYFWTMFLAGQRAAEDARTAMGETPITGALAAHIRSQVRFGKEYLPLFGYPDSDGNFVSTFVLDKKKAETETGADLGLFIDISLGDVQVRKLALFQAKPSERGRANIFSPNDQLGKLSVDPRKGFYLFYHRQEDYTPTPSVTVCRASDLQTYLVANPSSLTATQTVPTTSKAWDFASFVTFGLACSDNDIGVPFLTIPDALNEISPDPERIELPMYLQFVTLGTPSDALEKMLEPYGYKPLLADRRRRDLTREIDDDGGRGMGGPRMGGR